MRQEKLKKIMEFLEMPIDTALDRRRAHNVIFLLSEMIGLEYPFSFIEGTMYSHEIIREVSLIKNGFVEGNYNLNEYEIKVLKSFKNQFRDELEKTDMSEQAVLYYLVKKKFKVKSTFRLFCKYTCNSNFTKTDYFSMLNKVKAISPYMTF